MTLDQFITEERRWLEAFEHYWRSQAATNPADYPNELGSVDWREMLAMFPCDENGNQP